MTDLNKSLLQSIDDIETAVMESELSVCYALGEGYQKMAMITEFASESVDTSEYEIFQEATAAIEGKAQAQLGGPVAEPEKEKIGTKVWNKIKVAANFIWEIILKCIKWVKRQLEKLGNWFKNLFNKKEEGEKVLALTTSADDHVKQLETAIGKGDATETVKAADQVINDLNKLKGMHVADAATEVNAMKGKSSKGEGVINMPAHNPPALGTKEDNAFGKGQVVQQDINPSETKVEGQRTKDGSAVILGRAIDTCVEIKKEAEILVKADKDSKQYQDAVNRLKGHVSKINENITKAIETYKAMAEGMIALSKELMPGDYSQNKKIAETLNKEFGTWWEANKNKYGKVAKAVSAMPNNKGLAPFVGYDVNIGIYAWSPDRLIDELEFLIDQSNFIDNTNATDADLEKLMKSMITVCDKAINNPAWDNASTVKARAKRIQRDSDYFNRSIDKFIENLKKNPNLSTAAVEKFARDFRNNVGGKVTQITSLHQNMTTVCVDFIQDFKSARSSKDAHNVMANKK